MGKKPDIMIPFKGMIRQSLYMRLTDLSMYKNDQVAYLNIALETWLNENEEQIKALNMRLKPEENHGTNM